MVDVNINGRTEDENVLEQTSIGKALCENTLNIPKPNVLSGAERVLPYVFIGGDAFHLTENLMVPFNNPVLTTDQVHFNYRLGRVRQVAKNALEFLCSQFGVLQKPINLSPDKVQVIVLACCYLHNFLRRKTQDHILNGSVYTEDMNSGVITNGSWGKDSELTPLQSTMERISPKSANNIRDNFMQFFNNEDQVR